MREETVSYITSALKFAETKNHLLCKNVLIRIFINAKFTMTVGHIVQIAQMKILIKEFLNLER